MSNAITNTKIIELYKIENNLSCEIHTYSKWQELGYQVKKGEKSQHFITIWKCAKCKKKEEDEITKTKMFLKRSAFFTISQVEKIPCKV